MSGSHLHAAEINTTSKGIISTMENITSIHNLYFLFVFNILAQKKQNE